MNDYFLKATSAAKLHSALKAAKLESADGLAEGVALDEIGRLDGGTGWHANLRTAEPLSAAALARLPVIDAPDTPTRVWAGESVDLVLEAVPGVPTEPDDLAPLEAAEPQSGETSGSGP